MLRGCWQCGADVCVSVQIDSSSSFLSTHATNQISVGAHGGAQSDRGEGSGGLTHMQMHRRNREWEERLRDKHEKRVSPQQLAAYNSSR